MARRRGEENEEPLRIRAAIDWCASWEMLRPQEPPRCSFEKLEPITTVERPALMGRPFPEKGLIAIGWGTRYAVWELAEEGGFALALFTRADKARQIARTTLRATDGKTPRLPPESLYRMTWDMARRVAKLNNLPALILLDNSAAPRIHWVR